MNTEVHSRTLAYLYRSGVSFSASTATCGPHRSPRPHSLDPAHASSAGLGSGAVGVSQSNRRARKVTEPVVAAAQSARRPAKPTNEWDRQPKENDLWYSRFLRFVALGPGRSVSLVATGRRNAYPVPAHWPIQAKQWSWRERAQAFDEAYKTDPAKLGKALLSLLATALPLATNGETELLEKTIESGGYHPPEDEDEYGDGPDTPQST